MNKLILHNSSIYVCLLAGEAQLLSVLGGKNFWEARKWDLLDFLDQCIQVHVKGKTIMLFCSSSLMQSFNINISVQLKPLNAFLTLMDNKVIRGTLREASVIAEKLNELFYITVHFREVWKFNTIEVFIGEKYEEWSHVELLLEEGDPSGEISGKD